MNARHSWSAAKFAFERLTGEVAGDTLAPLDGSVALPKTHHRSLASHAYRGLQVTKKAPRTVALIRFWSCVNSRFFFRGITKFRNWHL